MSASKTPRTDAAAVYIRSDCHGSIEIEPCPIHGTHISSKEARTMEIELSEAHEQLAKLAAERTASIAEAGEYEKALRAERDEARASAKRFEDLWRQECEQARVAREERDVALLDAGLLAGTLHMAALKLGCDDHMVDHAVQKLLAERDAALAEITRIKDPTVVHAHCKRYLTEAQIAHLFGERMTAVVNNRDAWKACAEKLNDNMQYWMPGTAGFRARCELDRLKKENP